MTELLYQPDPAAEAVIAESLAHLASPGSFFTGAERVAIAQHARVARGLAASAPELPPIVAEAAARIAVEAITVRPPHIDAWVADGRDVVAYVELVAVVAKICSIDSYRNGLGTQLDALPAPVPGDAVPDVAENAQTMNAWVPTVGIALAPTSLSALPKEKASKAALGEVWYINDKQVHQYDVEPGRELTRAQMELVASRTSWLNECFF